MASTVKPTRKIVQALRGDQLTQFSRLKSKMNKEKYDQFNVMSKEIYSLRDKNDALAKSLDMCAEHYCHLKQIHKNCLNDAYEQFYHGSIQLEKTSNLASNAFMVFFIATVFFTVIAIESIKNDMPISVLIASIIMLLCAFICMLNTSTKANIAHEELEKINNKCCKLEAFVLFF